MHNSCYRNIQDGEAACHECENEIEAFDRQADIDNGVVIDCDDCHVRHVAGTCATVSALLTLLENITDAQVAVPAGRWVAQSAAREGRF